MATTSPSSRCSATSRSGSTSRKERSSSRREFVRDHMRLDWDRIWVTVHAGDPQLKLGPGRGRNRALAADGHADRADRAAADGRELLVGAASPARAAPTPSCTTTGARSTDAASPICAPACPRCARFLEFWNLVFMSYERASGRHADAATEGEHRHRARARARRSDPPGRHVRLRDRRVPADHGLDRSRVRRCLRRLSRPRRRRTASSPTTVVA